MSLPPFVLDVALFLLAAFAIRRMMGCVMRLAVFVVVILLVLYLPQIH
jgi:hypothetical protein